MHLKSGPLCCKRRGKQKRKRYDKIESLFSLSWSKTICVKCGIAPKIIEIMLQRPYGVRGLVSLRFNRRLWGSSKMSCVWLLTRVCILSFVRVYNHMTRLLAIVAYDLRHVLLAWCTNRASRLKILTIGSMPRSMFSKTRGEDFPTKDKKCLASNGMTCILPLSPIYTITSFATAKLI